MEERLIIRTSSSRSCYLLISYIAVASAFLFSVWINQRGYQDPGILDGILIPTAIFVLVSVFVMVFAEDNRLTAIVAAIFLVSLNLIPGLKYQLFYGCYDSVAHYGYVQSLVSLGHVPQTGFYAPAYSDTPGMHILIGSFSLVSGISVNDVLRFVIPAMYGIFPLVVFFITRDILDQTAQRFIIIVSSFPLVGILGYALSGTTIGLLLFVLFLAFLFRRMSSSKRGFTIALLVLSFALTISHGVTSLFLSLILGAAAFVLVFLRSVGASFPSRSQVHGYVTTFSFLITLVMTWWSYKATLYLTSIAVVLQRVFASESSGQLIPNRFFEIPLWAKLRILLVAYSEFLVMMFVSLIGILLLVKMVRRGQLGQRAKDFYLHLTLLASIILGAILIQFVIGLGGIGYDRFLCYAVVLSPFLVGLVFWRLNKCLAVASRKWAANTVIAIIYLALLLVCLIQAFSYEPLIPKASVLSQTLPEDVPLVDFRAANTIYKVKLISFAEAYSSPDSRIASDTVTRFQMYGFAKASFSSRNMYFSPLESPGLDWTLLLLQTSDKAGPFNEKAEYHTQEYLDEFRTAGNVVYDNGLSIIVVRPPYMGSDIP